MKPASPFNKPPVQSSNGDRKYKLISNGPEALLLFETEEADGATRKK